MFPGRRMGGEGWLLTPRWLASSWPARSPAPCLAGQGVTLAGGGGACHRLGHHLPQAVPSAGTTSLLPRLLSRRSLAPGPPLPQPPSQSLRRPCRHSGLPFSAFPPQPSPSKPETHPRPRAPQAQPALGGPLYIQAVVHPISPGPARKNPPWSWPLRTASSAQGTVGKLGCPGPGLPISS